MLRYAPPKEKVPNVYDYTTETSESYKNLLVDMKETIESFTTSTKTKISSIINDRTNWVPSEMYYHDFKYGWFRMKESGTREYVSLVDCSRYPEYKNARILFIVLDKKIDENDTEYKNRVYESPAIPLYTPFDDVLRNALIKIDTDNANCNVYLGDTSPYIHLDFKTIGIHNDILKYRIGIQYVTLKDHARKMVRDLNGAIETFKRSLGTVEYLLEEDYSWSEINK